MNYKFAPYGKTYIYIMTLMEIYGIQLMCQFFFIKNKFKIIIFFRTQCMIVKCINLQVSRYDIKYIIPKDIKIY